MTEEQQKPDTAGSLALRLVVMVIAMFGFAFLVLPPIYDAFCEVTGLGGKPNKVAAVVEETIVADRVVRLEFDTTVNQYAPWEFTSTIDEMTIHPGAIYETTFVARNLSDRHMTAQAVPSITPSQAAKYFKKLECFCFTTQEFAAHESLEMAVRFIVKSDLPEHIDTITLSYTFFDTARVTQNTGHEPLSQH